MGPRTRPLTGVGRDAQIGDSRFAIGNAFLISIDTLRADHPGVCGFADARDQFLGVLLLQLGDVTLAENHLRQALDLRPDYPSAPSRLARLLAATGRPAEAGEIQSKARP